MHTIKIKVQDNVYEHVIFLLENISKQEIEIISDDSFPSKADTKTKLKELFSKKNIEVFKDISNAVTWQQSQRDEW